MHGPFVVAQRTRGLLQDLTRVISPQRVDLAGWRLGQEPHEHPQVIKIGRQESRFSSGIQKRAEARREQAGTGLKWVWSRSAKCLPGGQSEFALLARKRRYAGSG